MGIKLPVSLGYRALLVSLDGGSAYAGYGTSVDLLNIAVNPAVVLATYDGSSAGIGSIKSIITDGTDFYLAAGGGVIRKVTFAGGLINSVSTHDCSSEVGSPVSAFFQEAGGKLFVAGASDCFEYPSFGGAYSGNFFHHHQVGRYTGHHICTPNGKNYYVLGTKGTLGAPDREAVIRNFESNNTYDLVDDHSHAGGLHMIYNGIATDVKGDTETPVAMSQGFILGFQEQEIFGGYGTPGCYVAPIGGPGGPASLEVFGKPFLPNPGGKATTATLMRLGKVGDFVTTITGFEHLAGETITIVVDGQVITITVGADGSFTLDRAGQRIHGGIPYISDIETLNIESPEGTVQGQLSKIAQVMLRFYKSHLPFVGPTSEKLLEIKQRGLQDEKYGEATKLFTGDVKKTLRPSWNSNGRLFIRQIQPAPFTLLAIVPNLTVEDDDED